MTVQEIQRLCAFNAWATNRVFEALGRISKDDYRRDLKASFGSLHGTMTHLVAAERLWLSRLTGKPESAMMAEPEVPSLETLKKVWEDAAARTARFVSRLDDRALGKSLEYVTTEGKTHANSVQQILQHVVNHSSYHRGQIASMLRQLGGEPVNTDMIAFFRHTAV
jgi:uncharacterized damage-inducible protein DinB